jgi:hypothetical protein
MLRQRVSPADLARVVTTPRYWATVGNPEPSAANVNAIVDELTHSGRILKETAEAITSAAVSWHMADKSYASLVLVDSNFWIEHSGSFGLIDWHGLVANSKGPGHVSMEDELRLVVPILAIDELDNLTHKASTRPKAAGAANWLYDLLGGSTGRPATIRAADEDRGEAEVSIQLVFDPIGHIRQPINDDELIERTIAFRDFMGIPHRQTFMLTYDTGAAFRADNAGLMPRLLPRQP